MDRHRGRKGRRPGRPPARRTPPPAGTGLEARFFEEAQRKGTSLELTLVDGTIVCGTVQEFDRDQVTIEDSSGPIVIRKSEIRYLTDDQ